MRIDGPVGLSIAIPLIYAAVGIVYVVFGDLLLFSYWDQSPLEAELSMAKGAIFVAVTTTALFVALRIAFVPSRAFAGVARSHVETIEALPNIFFDIDTEGRLRDWNSQTVRISGYTPDQLRGRPPTDFLHEGDRERVAAELSRLLKGETQEPTEAVLVTADGRSIPYLWHAAARHGEDGRIVGLIGIGIDISHEKEMEAKLREALGGSRKALGQTVLAIAHAVELRDPYTSGHQSRVGDLSQEIARRLGWPDHRIEGLFYGALLHDVGKLALPGDILVRPGRLSELEFEIVKTHTVHGYEVLKDIDFPWPVADIARHHHERIDGSGYPDGLRGDQISLEAQIVGIADVVEAMTSHRPYRPAVGLDLALQEIREGAGKRYDRALVDACLGAFEAGFSFDSALPGDAEAASGRRG